MPEQNEELVDKIVETLLPAFEEHFRGWLKGIPEEERVDEFVAVYSVHNLDWFIRGYISALLDSYKIQQDITALDAQMLQAESMFEELTVVKSDKKWIN